METDEIKYHIMKGLIKGYTQNLLFLSSYTNFIYQIREYILTVNVAQQLLAWNERYTYKIQIEYPISYFYNNAFAPFAWIGNDIFNMTMMHRTHCYFPAKTLHKKIDIAITQEQYDISLHERTLIGIELKGVNKSEEEIILDAERMIGAMTRTDNVSLNSVKACFCGFLKRFDKNNEIVTKKFIAAKISKTQLQWERICNELQLSYPILKFEVDVFKIEETPFEAVAEIHKEMDSDYSEVANDTGIVVGCILTITRI